MSKNYKIALGFVVALGFLVSANTFAASAPMTFSRNLSKGATGADVKQLQQFLNSCADTQLAVTAGSVGSPGFESMYFGPATTNAVKAYQTKNGVAPVLGNFFALTRAKAAAVGNVCGTNPNPNQPQTGPISAMLSTTNPASGVIVSGQATADLAHITFSGNGVVNSVMLKRSGISDQSTLSNVYLYDGVTRLTDGYSFNTTGDITINNLNLAVSGSRTISVKADVAGTSGQTIAVSLTGFTAGTSTNTVTIMGNTMSVASGTGILASATLSANTVIGTPTVNPGITNYTVWSAPLQVNTRSLWMKGANFRLIGSAESGALTNVKLYKDGVDTGKVASMTMTNGSNYISFDLSASPLEITTGSHTFDVRADIVKGSARTIQVSLQQASDLMLYDGQVGVNIAVGGTIANSAVSIGINAGSLTATLDTTFQGMTKITGGSSNATIAKYKLHAYGEDMKINTVTVLPILGTMTPAAAGLQNLTLYFNGSQVGTQVSSWTAGSQTFTLGSQLIVPANVDSTLEVRADLRTTGSVNYTAGTVSANLVAGTSTAEGQNSKNLLNVPPLTGNTLAVQTGNLSVSKNTAYGNTQTLSPNTSGVKVASFNLQNLSTSESVRVTSLTVTTTTGAGSFVTDYASIKTSETSGSGNTPVQPSAVTTTTSSNVFSVDFTLAPNATKTVDILVDANSVPASGSILASMNVSFIGVTSNVANTSGVIAGQSAVTFNTATITNPPTITSSATVSQYVAAADAGMTGVGATDASKSVFNIASSGGISSITELKFAVIGSGTVSGVKVGGTTGNVQTVGGSDWVSISGLNLPVANGGSGLNQDVFVSYSPVGTNGVTSGTTSNVSLAYIEYKSGSTTKTLCTAAAATAFGTTCTATLGSAVAGNAMTMVGSKPTIVAAKPSTTISTSTEAIDVTVTADAKGDVTLNTLPVKVVGGGTITLAAGTGIVVKDEQNQTVVTTSTAYASNISTITFTGGYVIHPGTPKTFRIFVPVTSFTPAGVQSVSISASLPTAGFTWTDTAGNGTSGAGAATLITTFPDTFTSVIYN